MFWGGGLGLRRISGSRGLMAFGLRVSGFGSSCISVSALRAWVFRVSWVGNPYMLANHMKLRPDTANRDSQVA